MAAAGLWRAATTSSGGSSLRLRTRRAEYRELLFHCGTGAFRAAYFFADGKNDGLETMLAIVTVVFKDRHRSSLLFLASQQKLNNGICPLQV